MARKSHWKRRYFTGTRPGERVLILIVLAIMIGVSLGLLLPQTHERVAQITGEYYASGPASQALDTLRVDDNTNVARYNRTEFGYRSTDDDHNGCDVREDVLARDLSDVVYKRGTCKVQSGTLNDPYTGKTIYFVRGNKTSALVQIDHVVALENAWISGANKWSSAKKIQFGNDMHNLLAVDGPANQEKGSASAAYWLPTNSAYRCAYVAKQISVKKQYDLSVTTKEYKAMKAVLRSCPTQQLI